MVDEFAEIRALRERFLRAAYDHRDTRLGAATDEVVMRALGLIQISQPPTVCVIGSSTRTSSATGCNGDASNTSPTG